MSFPTHKRAFQRLAAAALLFIAGHCLALDPSRAPTQYASDEWSTVSGMPCNTVRCMAQTQDGFLWLGTPEGLARFDGRTFKIITRDLAPELKSDSISALCATTDGALWVGTETGLSLNLKTTAGRPWIFRMKVRLRLCAASSRPQATRC